MTAGQTIAFAFDAASGLPVDRDVAAHIAAYILRHIRGGTWGIA